MRPAKLLAVAAAGMLWTSCGSDAPKPKPEAPPKPTTEAVAGEPGVMAASSIGATTDLGQIIAGETESRRLRQEKVLADASALARLLNQFWIAELAQNYGVTFVPPTRFEYYEGATNPACGLDRRSMENNAYFCPTDDFIAFDLNWFQQYLVDHPGGATTFLILAHEWGHAVQDTWLENGGTDEWNPLYRRELNADCLAGVFLASAVDSGTVVLHEGDEDAIFSWLYAEGSDDSPWLEPGDHGTRSQRRTAFLDGYGGSTDQCRSTY